MGSCYLLLIGISAVVASASLRHVHSAKAMEAMSMAAAQIFLLIVLAVIGQILWDTYLSKKAKNSQQS